MKRILIGFLVFSLALFLITPAVSAEEVKITTGNWWPSSLVLAGVVKAESEMAGLPYEFIIKGLGYPYFYEAVKDGSSDLHTVGWLPNTHAAVWPDAKLDTAGVQIADTWLGLCASREKAQEVAQYLGVADEESITLSQVLTADVVNNLFGGVVRVYGYSSGLKTLTEALVPSEYWSYIYSTDEFDAAIANGELVSWWTPHVVFAKKDIVKFVDDQNAYPTDDGVSCVYRTVPKAKPSLNPDLLSLLEGLSYPVDDFQAMMYEFVVDNEGGALTAIELGDDASIAQMSNKVAVWYKIISLIEQVEELNGEKGGILNSLVSKLDGATDVDAPETMHKINAFINQCEDLRGDELTEEEADALIAAAQAILADLEAGF